MRAAVIAAAGNLGGRVLKECLDRGWQVTAFVNNAPCRDERAQQVRKSLFDLTKEDIAGFDVVFSAFGSGFKANPTINRQALNALAALTAGTSRRFLAIVGSGCLYTDEKKEIRAYETAEYPPFLKEISMNTALGVQDVAVMEDVHYTFVCPGQCFDGETRGTGAYITDTSMTQAPKNEDGASYTTYDDLAKAMVDFAQTGMFDRTFVTVLSKVGYPARENHT